MSSSPRVSAHATCLVGVLSDSAASASSPPTCAHRAGAAADLRAAAHLSEMRAAPEVAHQPQPVYLVTAAHPREPERAAAAGRTQPGTSSHRRHGAVLRCQVHQAAEGSVQVSRDRMKARQATMWQALRGSETENRRSLQETGRRSEWCSNRKDAEEDARLQMPSPGYPARVHGRPRAPPRRPRRHARLSVTAEGSQTPPPGAAANQNSQTTHNLRLVADFLYLTFHFDACTLRD